MTHLTETQRGALDRLRRQHDPGADPAAVVTKTCKRCNDQFPTIDDGADETTCPRCVFAALDLAAELRRGADLAHEALGLAWAAEATRHYSNA